MANKTQDFRSRRARLREEKFDVPETALETAPETVPETVPEIS